MPRTIIISLPVADLDVAKAFYGALGFVASSQWSGPDAAHMVWSDTISVMLLTHAKWHTFTDRPIAPRTSSEVGLNLSCESRAQVDAMNKAAAENGGVADVNPVEDHAFMYGRDFMDPDGHIWGAQWMDATAAQDT